MTKRESTHFTLLAALSTAALVFFQTSCRTAAMVHPESLPYPSMMSGSDSATADHVRSAIAVGARRAGWRTEEPEPGTKTIHARFTVRPEVFVTIEIGYDDGQITLRYADSSNFKCDPLADGCATIHKRYNTQLLRLHTQIQQALTEPVAQPLDISQAVSIVRQVVEEQPRRTAYLSVDVTEERVSAVRKVVKPVHYSITDLHHWGYFGHHGFYPHDVFDAVMYVSTSETDVVYFNNIGRIELFAKRRGQVIQIWDRYGKSRIRLYSPDDWLAKRFVDAVGVLEHARLKIEENYLSPDGSSPD